MSEAAAAAPAATETIAPVAPSPVAPTVDRGTSVEDAARALTAARTKAIGDAQTPKDTQPRVNGRFAAFEGQPNSAPEGADAGPEAVPSETEQDDPVEELPPIDPPRSWSKEDKELFNSLPRETQERVAERERSRESDFLKRQHESTERTRALEAKEKAADEARTQYEQAAQNALHVLQQQQASEFADIKTQADVQKLATEDPFRFVQWQARQQLISHQISEVQNLQTQREQERSQKFQSWSKEQDSAFEKMFPEFTDKEKAPALRSQVASYLTEQVGVPEEHLSRLWNTDMFRDAMWQRVIYDASRFHSAQQKAKSAVQAPKPQVQRPGTAPPKGQIFQESIDAARERLKGAKGERATDAAVAWIQAKRKASR
jgi:hypothetical protein